MMSGQSSWSTTGLEKNWSNLSKGIFSSNGLSMVEALGLFHLIIWSIQVSAADPVYSTYLMVLLVVVMFVWFASTQATTRSDTDFFEVQHLFSERSKYSMYSVPSVEILWGAPGAPIFALQFGCNHGLNLNLILGSGLGAAPPMHPNPRFGAGLHLVCQVWEPNCGQSKCYW